MELVYIIIYVFLFSIIAFMIKEEENLKPINLYLFKIKNLKNLIPFMLCLIAISIIWTYNLSDIEIIKIEIAFILFLALIIFYLIMEFGFERIKWWLSLYFLSGGIINYIASYFLTIYISEYSNVSVEKISTLINNATFIFFPYILLCYTAIILSFFSFFNFIYLLIIWLSIKTKIFKYNEKSKKFRRSGLFIKGDNLLYLLLLMTTSSLTLFVLSIENRKGIETQTDNIITLFMSKNNGKCNSINNEKKIYFYESNRVIIYQEKSAVKFKDSICNIKIQIPFDIEAIGV